MSKGYPRKFVESRFSLDDGGQIILYYPTELTDEEYKDAIAWLKIIRRQLKRSIVGSFTVHATQGQGDVVLGTYRTITDAKRYVAHHMGEASFAIKQPDGKWYKWRKKEYQNLTQIFGKGKPDDRVPVSS